MARDSKGTVPRLLWKLVGRGSGGGKHRKLYVALLMVAVIVCGAVAPYPSAVSAQALDGAVARSLAVSAPASNAQIVFADVVHLTSCRLVRIGLKSYRQCTFMPNLTPKPGITLPNQGTFGSRSTWPGSTIGGSRQGLTDLGLGSWRYYDKFRKWTREYPSLESPSLVAPRSYRDQFRAPLARQRAQDILDRVKSLAPYLKEGTREQVKCVMCDMLKAAATGEQPSATAQASECLTGQVESRIQALLGVPEWAQLQSELATLAAEARALPTADQHDLYMLVGLTCLNL